MTSFAKTLHHELTGLVMVFVDASTARLRPVFHATPSGSLLLHVWQQVSVNLPGDRDISMLEPLTHNLDRGIRLVSQNEAMACRRS